MSSEGNAVATPAVDIEELTKRITALGESIKQLKSSSEPDKDAIATAVNALLDSKRTYAKNNGGVGVDGKPWEEPMTKAQKKAADKAKKAAAAAGGGGAGANQESSGKKICIDVDGA